MPGLFSSSKKTDQSGSSTTNFNSNTTGAFDQTGTSSGSSSASSSGTATQSGTGTTTPVLDPSMAPLIPKIAGKADDLLGMSPADLVPDLNDQITGGAAAVHGAATKGLGQYNSNMGENNAAIKGAMGTLTDDPNITFDGSGIPSAISGGSARDIGAQQIAGATVDGATILNDMNPYQSSVIDTQNALMNRNAGIALARLRAGNAGQKSFGDRAALSESDLMQNLFLNQSSTLAGLAQSGYQTAQQQAEADAARTLQTQQSNQGAALTAQQSNQSADVDMQRRIAAASLANQQTGLKSAEDVMSAKQAEAAAKVAQATAAGNLAVQSGGLAGDFMRTNVAAGVADMGAGAPAQDVLQRRANAPVTQLGDVASVVYGAPQGSTTSTSQTGTQTGTQSGTQTGTTTNTGTSSGTTAGNQSTVSTGTSKTTNNPSIFQDIVGVGSMIMGGFKSGGLMRRYADGGAFEGDGDRNVGALDPANPGVQDWYAGRVQSSDMGAPEDAPLTAPSLPQMQVDAAAMRMPSAPLARRGAESADVPSSGLSRFSGALTRFVNRMADSPLSQFGMGVLAEPQSGLAPLSSGLQAVLAHRAQLSKQALESAQTAAMTESTRERQSMFGFQKRALEEEYPGSPGLEESSVPGASGPGAAAAASQAAAAPPAPRPVPSDAVPLSLQWMQKGFERNRRLALAGLPGAGAMADKFLGMLSNAVPKNMQFDPKTAKFQFVPGYLEGETKKAADVANAELPAKAFAEYFRGASIPQHIGPNEVVIPGARPPFDVPGAKPGSTAFGGEGGGVEPAPTFTPNPDSETPAADEANSDTRPFLPIRDQKTGIVGSQWTDLTKKQMDAFDSARTKAIDAAEHAQESDNDIKRLEQAFSEMKTKGVQTGYFTPAMGQLAAMAKSLNIDTSAADKFIPSKDSVGDIQAANKISKELMGRILKQMYPQRITNADMVVNKGIAPGPDIDEAANMNLINQIKAQNAYDKNFAKEVLAVDLTNPRAALGFQRAFYKKYGFGPLAGAYFSQGSDGKITGKEFSTTIPKGIPAGSYNTGMLTKDGKGQVWRTPAGESKAYYPGGP